VDRTFVPPELTTSTGEKRAKLSTWLSLPRTAPLIAVVAVEHRNCRFGSIPPVRHPEKLTPAAFTRLVGAATP
jgi:hypothetical protein